MVDTKRTQTEILALLASNTEGDISAQDHRDQVVSARANQGGGWAFYSESTAITQGTAQSISAATRTKLLCDGLGAFTSVDQIQDMVPSWVGDAIFPELNCAYDFRLTFKTETATAGSGHYLTVELDIGSGGLGTGPVIWSGIDVLAKGAGVEHALQYSIPIFAKDPFPANGGSFYIESDVALDVWDMRVFINRTYKPDN